MIVTIIYNKNQEPIGWELYGESQAERKKMAIIQDLTFTNNRKVIKFRGDNSLITNIKTSKNIMTYNVKTFPTKEIFQKLKEYFFSFLNKNKS